MMVRYPRSMDATQTSSYTGRIEPEVRRPDACSFERRSRDLLEHERDELLFVLERECAVVSTLEADRRTWVPAQAASAHRPRERPGEYPEMVGQSSQLLRTRTPGALSAMGSRSSPFA